MSHRKRPARSSGGSSLAKAPPRTQVKQLPTWKKAIFGLMVSFVLLVALELVLALAGVKVARFEQDPYVGFSRKVPHFVPDTGAAEAGTLVTAENKRRVLNLQRFAAKKPKNTYRIFCLGGSTTYGHPYTDPTSFCGWLRAMLPKADPSRRWELINGGGISYASYREALLMEELIAYQPDLFIVLSAHNEFLEERTYAAIKSVPEFWRSVNTAAARTHLYSAMKVGLERFRSDRGGSLNSSTNFLSENPDAILDRTIGPQSYHRDENRQRDIVEHYRFNLSRMVDMARSVGAKVIFVSPASNLRSCSPFKSEHRTGLAAAERGQWENLVRQALDARQRQNFQEALKFIEQASVIDNRYAELHYLRGHTLWDLERYAEAKVAFVRARDEDVCPLRALSSLIDATREVATTRGVPFVDLEKILEDRSLQHIPGDDWFLDHVHPTTEGHRQLALELMNVMTRQSILQPVAAWNEAAQREVKQAVESSLTPKDQAVALVTLAKVLAWSGKAEDAYRVSIRAAQLLPDDASVQFELGKNAAHIGRRDDAIRNLRRAVELHPKFVEALSLLGTKLMESGENEESLRYCRQAVELRPDDPLLLINLGEILRRRGQTAEALASFENALRISPNYAEAHNNLGWVLKDLGRHTEALEHFRQAVRLRPGAVTPMLGLAWLLAAHPEQSSRRPQEAVRLGEQLAEMSAYRNWMSLDTLAVAYAADGRFAEAVKIEEKALDLVQAASPPDASAVRQRLDLFRQGNPFVEPIAKPTTK